MSFDRREFDALKKRLHWNTDVLIQMSESYYRLCTKLDGWPPQHEGIMALRAIRQAVGFEIVNRLYRLTDTKSAAQSFPKLSKRYLQDDAFCDGLFASRADLDRAEFEKWRSGIIKLVGDILASPERRRLEIFRHRYTGHAIPSPVRLEEFGADADIHSLSSAELRKITDGLSGAVDMLLHIADGSSFPYEDIAKWAQESFDALFGDSTPTPSFLNEELGERHSE